MSLLDTASLIVTPNGYKEGKLYSVIPSDGSGDLSVTRATTATRVNSAGLVELVPYNLFTYSEQFDNAAWGKNLVTITSNATTAPNGTTTADKIIIDNGSQDTPVVFVISDSETSTRTLSFYAKASEYNIAYARIGGAFNAPIVLYSLTGSGSILHNQNASSYSIESVGNGWYRCSMTYAHGSSFAPCIGVCSATYTVGISTVVTTGNGTSGIFIWGAQLNEGTIKPYQKTETRLNIPRLDYSNGTCPSILVEPQRTNLVTYSSSFDNAAWNKSSGTITANNTTAPDGTTTADLFTADGTQNNHDFFQGFTGGSSTTSTIYLKKNTAQYAYISLNYQGSGSDWATGIYDLDNLTTATFQSGGVTNQVATISDEGNGWRRITLSVSTGNTALFCMYGVSDSMSPTLSARGRVENSSSASFYAWGAQLEAGSYATSYIPTTSASVTRNADVISKTGISSLIGQTEGTLFVDFYNYGNNSTTTGCPICIANGGFYGNAIYIEQYLGNWYAVVWNGSSQQFISSPLSLSVGRHKLALAYKSNDIAFYSDGVLVGTDTSATIPTCDGAYIGAVGTSTTPEQLAVNASALWKTRLTNTQLAQLTTI